MKITGEVYRAEGWEVWEHECSDQQAREIRAAARALAKQRQSGPIAPTYDEILAAADT